MPIEQVPEPSYYQPVGTTDSEKIFCWILSELRSAFDADVCISQVSAYLHTLCNRLNALGINNILLSDGDAIFAFCSTKLHWVARKAPFGEAQLRDCDLSIDFASVNSDDHVSVVIATEPLTNNEQWTAMKSGEGRMFVNGESAWCDFGPQIEHKKNEQTKIAS